MILTFMSQNLLFGGLRDGDGNQKDRWPELLKRIDSVERKADFLLLQETWGWEDYSHKALVRARNDLDMESMPLPYSPDNNGTGLLYRQQTVGRWQNWSTEHGELLQHGFGVAGFDVELSSLLSVMSVHLDAFGSDRALQEIEVVANRAYKNGPFAVMGGDFNYTASRGPNPNYDYAGIPPYNVQGRTMLSDPTKNEPLLPDRRIGWKLERADMVDVAYYMFDKTKDKKYLENTANDPPDRIDQFWVSRPLASGIINYWVISQPENASDHKGIAFQLDTALINKPENWHYH
jgi:endonuclease/exonuclease/phosphatase family metal-dependent hydrolase